LENFPILLNLVGVKYYLTKQPFEKEELLNNFYNPLHQIGDVYIYINKYYLPLGFAYSNHISRKEYDRLNVIQRQTIFLSATVMEAGQASGYQVDPNYSYDKLNGDISLLRESQMEIESFDDNTIKGKIEVKENKILFFSIPYDKGWKLKLNNQPVELLNVNIGFMGAVIDKGKYNIELSYHSPYVYESAGVSLIGFLFFIAMIIKEKRQRLPIAVT
jgi:uncharacterized membrane protein YfhO